MAASLVTLAALAAAVAAQKSGGGDDDGGGKFTKLDECAACIDAGCFDFNALRSESADYTLPVGSDCPATECGGSGGSGMPWPIHINFCDDLVSPRIGCDGAGACVELTFQDESLGRWDAAEIGPLDAKRYPDATGLTYRIKNGQAVGLPFPPGGTVLISSEIAFICDGTEDERPVFTERQVPDWIYHFEWHHPIACGGGGGVSVGTILLILLLVGVIVYLVGFAAYNYKMRGARGLEIVPHRSFWMSLPEYVLDGMRFSKDKFMTLIGRD